MDTFLIHRNSPLRSGSSRSNSTQEDIPFQMDSDGLSVNNNAIESDMEEDLLKAEDELKDLKNKSMLGYFMSELTKGYKLEADASEFIERRDRMYISFNTPKSLEKFCAFGFLQCMDSILYMVTFLPLRILVAILRVMIYPLIVLFNGRSHALDAAQTCDLLKGVILVVSCFVTSFMDMSMVYHIVRGQSIIKFYVFYNMLDVMDKLISGFGQDVLDSLYWTAVEPRGPGRRREHFGTLFHLAIAIVYAVVHTLLILMQAIILNVAFNSHNKNLLTIMMSNNFIEIKGNLFKRLDKNNLCQITYSDVKERFHYLVLLVFVFIRNMKEMQWNWDQAGPIVQDCAIVLVAEFIVDWIKHAFITKFNELPASLYADYSLGLAQDIASSQQKHAFTNFNDQVCRRMGFTPIPLICLLFMVCSKSFTLTGPSAWLLLFVLYLCLMSTKVLNSIVLLGWAQRLLNERDKNAKATATVVDSQVVPKKDSGPPKDKVEPNKEDQSKRQRTTSSNVTTNTDPVYSINKDGNPEQLYTFNQASQPIDIPVKPVMITTVDKDSPYHELSISNRSSRRESHEEHEEEYSTPLKLKQQQQIHSTSAVVTPKKAPVLTPLKPQQLPQHSSVTPLKGSESDQKPLTPVRMDFQTDFFSQDVEISKTQDPSAVFHQNPIPSDASTISEENDSSKCLDNSHSGSSLNDPVSDPQFYPSPLSNVINQSSSPVCCESNLTPASDGLEKCKICKVKEVPSDLEKCNDCKVEEVLSDLEKCNDSKLEADQSPNLSTDSQLLCKLPDALSNWCESKDLKPEETDDISYKYD